MKVIITLDRYDGTQSKQKEVDLENIRISDLAMYLTEAKTASVTITKVSDLQKMISKMGGSNETDQ